MLTSDAERTVQARRVLASCAAVAIFDGFDVQAMAFVATRLSRQWSVPVSQFGLVFAAALFGLLLGSLLVAPLADQVGRKPLAVGAAVWVGLATLTTAFCTTIPQVTAARFATGIGLGAAIPVLVAVTHEAAPPDRRTLYVTLMYCGFPTGGFLGGLFTAWALPRLDWSTLFAGMGVLSLLLCLPLALVLEPTPSRARAFGRTRAPLPATHSEPLGTKISFAEMASRVKSLFVDGLALRTSLTWRLFIATLLNVYVLANWLPALLERRHFSESAAAIAAGIANLGGVMGGLILGALVNRWGLRVLSMAYVLGALFLSLLGFVSGPVEPAYL
ncbi:MAG: MFS transporter, partial [Steroidobacteraceae bacterium]